jgi:hypothetical protein
LDLLMDFDTAPPTASRPAAAADPLACLDPAAMGPVPTVPAAGAAAGTHIGMDLGSILSSPAPPHAAVAASSAGGGDLLDLGLISLGSPQPQQQLPLMPLPAMSTVPGAGAAAGAGAKGPVAMRGGQPAKGTSSLSDDPFKDLFG